MTTSLPDVLFVGPQRCGTTWVHEYLANHPGVQLPVGTKETFFFDRHFGRGEAWYRSHFPATSPAGAWPVRICEVAPTYFHHPEAPQRVATLLGKPQVVITLRDPASRAFSLFLHERRKARVPATFEAALDAAPFILDSSCYARHVARWVNRFGEDQVRIVFQDDLRLDADAYAAELCRFMGIGVLPVPANLEGPTNEASVPRSQALAALGRSTADLLRRYRLYAPVQAAKRMGLKSMFFGLEGSGSVPVMSAEMRRGFIARVLLEIEALERMTDRDLSSWKAA